MGKVKFWKWMKEKGYGAYHKDNARLNYQLNSDYMNQMVGLHNPPKQMLIGFMIEYIRSTKIEVDAYTDAPEIEIDCGEEIEDTYKQLVKIIETAAVRSV